VQVGGKVELLPEYQWTQQEEVAAEALADAESLFQEKDFGRAASQFLHLASRFSETRLIDSRLRTRGDLTPLEDDGLDYLAQNPNYVGDHARVGLGRCYEAQGHKERALGVWSEVIEKGKRQGIAGSDVGNGLYLVFELQRPLVLALRSRTQCLTRMRRTQDALETADEIGKLYPGAQELTDLLIEMKGLAGSSAAPVVQRLRIALKERETRVRELEAVAVDKEFELRGIRATRKRLGLSWEPGKQ
jgi:tetratricopeptide (TPR) repeat protein